MFLRKRKTVDLPVVGVLKCRKTFIFGSSYSWEGGVKILNGKETFIVFDGDKDNPNRGQINAVSDIVLNFETVYAKRINYWLGLESVEIQKKFKNWETTYFLGMITPDIGSVFDITLEPINEDDLNFIFIEVEHKQVIKISF